MFKKNNYSKRALSTFEIIGACIVDIYYNEFYDKAKMYWQSPRYNFDSITEAYKHIIKTYILSFRNPKDYKQTVLRIHKYYYTTTKFQTISFSDCINNIVKHFLPEDFFESANNQERDAVLRLVLVNSVKQFSNDVLCSTILNSIIDDHSQLGLIRKMQDKMVQALMFEREKMFRNFFTATNNPNKSQDFTIIMKMKAEMIKLVKKNHILTNNYNKLKDKTMRLLDIVKGQKKRISKIEEELKHNNKPDINVGSKFSEYSNNKQSHIDNDRSIYIPQQTGNVFEHSKITQPIQNNYVNPVTSHSPKYQGNVYNNSKHTTHTSRLNELPTRVESQNISSMMVDNKFDTSHVVPEVSPVVPEASHVVPEVSHVVPEVSPVVPEASHVVPEVSHVVPEVSPVIENNNVISLDNSEFFNMDLS